MKKSIYRRSISIRLRSGYSVMELLVVLAFLATVVPSLTMLAKAYQKKKDSALVNERIKALDEAIRANYNRALDFSESHNCYGWTDNQCSGIGLTPIQGSSSKEIVFYTPVPSIVKKLRGVGCQVVVGSSRNGGTAVAVSCPDKTGKKLKMVIANGHTPGQSYFSSYKNLPFSVTIDSDDGNFHRVLSLGNLESYSNAVTHEKLVGLSNGIKRFVREIRIRELNNDCSDGGTAENPPGGLGSWDDPLVPWSWKLVSSSPYTLCQGSEASDGCGCSNHASALLWPTSGAYCRINTAAEWDRVLQNINLGKRYRTDGFGNKMTIIPTADSNGNPSTCPPPRPKPGYQEHSVLGKVRVGVYDSGAAKWLKYLDVYTD